MNKHTTPFQLEDVKDYLKKARSWKAQFRLQKTIEYAQLAQDVLDQLAQSDEKITLQLDTFYLRANAELELGHHKNALNHFQRALSFAKDALGDTHIDTARAHFFLAGMFESVWRLEPARDHYTQAHIITKKHLGPNDDNTQYLENQIDSVNKKLSEHPKNNI